MTTLKDVAERAGVSYSTVSLVLNGQSEKRKISEATRDRVLLAARELQYAPNVAAKRLKQSDSGRLSITVYWPSDYRTSFVSRIINGLYAAVNQSGEEVELAVCPYENDRLCENRLLNEGGACHGVIVAAASERDMEFLNERNFPFPIVILNRDSDRHSTVSIDNLEAGRMAARHLIGVATGGAVALIAREPYPAMLLHQQGFLTAMKAYGRPVERKYYAECSIAGGYAAMEELSSGPLPQALFCDSDAVARGALCRLAMEGARVPGELVVLSMGAGSPEACAYSVPPLTTVEIPHERLAEQGLGLLIREIRKELFEPCRLTLEAELKVRRSCP